MMNDFGEAIAAFVAMQETRKIELPKQLNTIYSIYTYIYIYIYINRKGEAPHWIIGLPLNSLFL